MPRPLQLRDIAHVLEKGTGLVAHTAIVGHQLAQRRTGIGGEERLVDVLHGDAGRAHTARVDVDVDHPSRSANRRHLAGAGVSWLRQGWWNAPPGERRPTM